MTQSALEIGERALRRLGVAIVPMADRPALNTMVPTPTIAIQALVELGVIASDEAPSTADGNLALDKLRYIQDSLASQALVWWSNTAGIPQALAEEYIRMTAISLASSFGKPGDLQAYAAMEARVKQMALIMSAPDLATQAVLDVHAEMDVLGFVRWSTQDIPDAIAQAYEAKAAVALAPLFGKPADPRADLEATRQFARYAALPSSDAPTPVDYF
jgi:hypothetical protein